MNPKGALVLFALGAAMAARADSFTASAISTSGDLSFGATATYWDPHINQITPSVNIGLNAPNLATTVNVVCEGTALGSWWFAGENWLTFAGTIQWNGAADPAAKVRVTSTIKDLDNGHQYQLTSTLDGTGSHWAGGLQFVQPTKRIRWTDKIELVSGATGTVAGWVNTNHTMQMTQVPEPTGIASLAVVAGLGLRFRLRRRTPKR
jgi:hypothetical protein